MKLVALKDVCRITNGGTPKSGIADFWHGDVAWLTPAEMGKRKTPEISETARTISQAGLAGSSAKLVPANSVILSTRAPIGHLAINQAPMAFNQGCRGLTPGDYLDTKFLYYFLYFSREALDGLGTGTTFKELSSSSLANFRIPLPLLDEQQRIVAVLDKAFVAIATATANVQKNKSNARALFESYLQSIFAERGEGWIEEPINKNVRFVDYRGKTPPKRDTGVRLITAKNVKMGYVRRDPEEFIDAAAYDGWMTRGFPQRGDVLFTTEAPLGNIAQLDTNEKVVIGQRLITMQPKPETVDRTFLKYMLCSAQLQQAIRAKGTGATVVGIKAKLLKLIPIFYPKRLEAQLEIVERLNGINARSQNLIGIYARQIAALAELKQSLLKKAFAGEFTATMAEAVAPAANDNFATAQGTANMIAFAYWLHKKQNRDKSFKRIKAQKCLHNVESIAGIDLGRQPMKHRNGPHDEAHMSRAEDWAREQGFFEFVQSTSGPGYDFKKLGNYDAMWAETVAATKTIAAALERAIDPLIPMDMEKAELFATVHAAWNNLLHNGAAITDDAIVKEARDDWHPDKLKIPEHKFRDTIRIIKAKNMEPDGSAKYVGGQVSLF